MRLGQFSHFSIPCKQLVPVNPVAHEHDPSLVSQMAPSSQFTGQALLQFLPQDPFRHSERKVIVTFLSGQENLQVAYLMRNYR